jgi:hypothetical protein
MEAAPVNRKNTKRSSNLHGERGGIAFPFAFVSILVIEEQGDGYFGDVSKTIK